ncbi:MAG: 2-oxoacid ferredoxin oxidoreductase, partial [Deltaproteobacteria bacterium]|nr:2-oxoacid ferredoxin oxidoreductase [Deltaproteobacteria bacterium]
MVSLSDYENRVPIAWCPGCGNFAILNALKQALVELKKQPHQILLVSGIGQAPKLPHYLRCNAF